MLLRPCVPYDLILQHVDEPIAIRAVLQAQAAGAAGAGPGGGGLGGASGSGKDKDKHVSFGEDDSDGLDGAGPWQKLLKIAFNAFVFPSFLMYKCHVITRLDVLSILCRPRASGSFEHM